MWHCGFLALVASYPWWHYCLDGVVTLVTLWPKLLLFSVVSGFGMRAFNFVFVFFFFFFFFLNSDATLM